MNVSNRVINVIFSQELRTCIPSFLEYRIEAKFQKKSWMKLGIRTATGLQWNEAGNSGPTPFPTGVFLLSFTFLVETQWIISCRNAITDIKHLTAMLLSMT